MADRFPALDALIRDVETITADQTDPLAVLVPLLHMLIQSDPYLLDGALIEGIAATIMQRNVGRRSSSEETNCEYGHMCGHRRRRVHWLRSLGRSRKQVRFRSGYR
jgi:hypothetical protein